MDGLNIYSKFDVEVVWTSPYSWFSSNNVQLLQLASLAKLQVHIDNVKVHLCCLHIYISVVLLDEAVECPTLDS